MRCPVRDECTRYSRDNLQCEYGHKTCTLYKTTFESYTEARRIKWEVDGKRNIGKLEVMT